MTDSEFITKKEFEKYRQNHYTFMAQKHIDAGLELIELREVVRKLINKCIDLSLDGVNETPLTIGIRELLSQLDDKKAKPSNEAVPPSPFKLEAAWKNPQCKECGSNCKDSWSNPCSQFQKAEPSPDPELTEVCPICDKRFRFIAIMDYHVEHDHPEPSPSNVGGIGDLEQLDKLLEQEPPIPSKIGTMGSMEYNESKGILEPPLYPPDSTGDLKGLVSPPTESSDYIKGFESGKVWMNEKLRAVLDFHGNLGENAKNTAVYHYKALREAIEALVGSARQTVGDTPNPIDFLERYFNDIMDYFTHERGYMDIDTDDNEKGNQFDEFLQCYDKEYNNRKLFERVNKAEAEPPTEYTCEVCGGACKGNAWWSIKCHKDALEQHLIGHKQDWNEKLSALLSGRFRATDDPSDAGVLIALRIKWDPTTYRDNRMLIFEYEERYQELVEAIEAILEAKP